MPFDITRDPENASTPVAEQSKRAAQILKAADALLVERGQDAVSMRDIAHRAGVNKALIFYYFGNRAQLFDAVLARYDERHDDVLRVILAPDGPPRSRVHRALDAYLDFIEDHELYVRLVQQELSRQEPQLGLIRVSLEKLHGALVQVFGAALPDAGPTASRQLAMSVGCLLLSHGAAYAETVVPQGSASDAHSDLRAERRGHLHWLADTLLDRLQPMRS